MSARSRGRGPTHETFAESFERAVRRLRVAAALSAAGAAACGPPPETAQQGTSGTSSTTGTGGVTGDTGGAAGSTGGAAGSTGGVTGSTGVTSGTGGGTGGVTSGSGGVAGGTGGAGGVTGDTGDTGGVDLCAPADPGMSGGTSDPTMVSFVSFTTMATSVFLKLKVKPVPGADLSKKKVFVTYRPFDHAQEGRQEPAFGAESTVVAEYAATLADGYEEWHATVDAAESPGRAPIFLFRVWYDDGAGSVYYDDNHGEQHAMHCQPLLQFGAGSFCSIARDPAKTLVTITNAGIVGHVDAIAPRLDPDSVAVLKWTTDNWATVHETPMTWLGQFGCGVDRWTIALDVPGSFVAMKYVLEYRHGVVNGAATYTFWDDNGGVGYVVLK